MAPDPAPLQEAQRPARAEQAPPQVEEDLVADRAKEEQIREADRVRQIDEREERRPENPVPGADVRRIDRSELRPYAIKVGGEYYVRIGAYDMRSEARSVASELARVTTELVDVVEFGMGDGRNAVRLYRVLVGPIASRAGLIELIAALDNVGYGEARVPPSIASESGRAAVPDRASSAGQRAAGPELVEVSLEPVGDEAAAPQTPAQEAQAVPEPSPRGATAMSGDNAGVSAVQVEVASSEPADPVANGPATTEEYAGTSRNVDDAGVAPTGVAPGVSATSAPQQEDRVPVVASAAEAPASQDTDPEATAQRDVSSPVGLAHNGVENPAAEPRFLQVGAYTVRSTAEALAAEVGRVARAPVRVVEAELVNGETMYRVQVGPIGSREAMMELSEMLTSGGYGTVRVLPGSEAADSAPERCPSCSDPHLRARPERRVKAFIVNEDERSVFCRWVPTPSARQPIPSLRNCAW